MPINKVDDQKAVCACVGVCILCDSATMRDEGLAHATGGINLEYTVLHGIKVTFQTRNHRGGFQKTRGQWNYKVTASQVPMVEFIEMLWNLTKAARRHHCDVLNASERGTSWEFIVCYTNFNTIWKKTVATKLVIRTTKCIINLLHAYLEIREIKKRKVTSLGFTTSVQGGNYSHVTPQSHLPAVAKIIAKKKKTSFVFVLFCFEWNKYRSSKLMLL